MSLQLTDLPDEILGQVLLFMEVKDILSVSATCKHLHWIVSEDELWHQLCLQFSPQSTLGAFVSWRTKYRALCSSWENRTITAVHVLNGAHAGSIRKVILRDDMILSCSTDTTVNRWDIKTMSRQQTYSFHSNVTRGLALDGDLFMTASYDNTAVVADLSGKEHHRIRYSESLLTCDMKAPVGVIGSSKGSLLIIDVNTGEMKHASRVFKQQVYCAKLHGNTVLLGVNESTASIYDLVTQKVVVSMDKLHSKYVLDVSQYENTVASGSGEGRVVLWDARTGEPIHSWMLKDTVNQASLGPFQLVTADDSAKIISWDLRKYESIHELRDHKGMVTTLDYDVSSMVSGDWGGRMIVWSIN